MDTRGSRSGGLVALGFFLARRGATAAVGLGLTVLCVVGFSVLSVVFAHRGTLSALPDVPLLASSTIAYSVGVLVAFAVSTRAFRRDEDEGIRELLRTRGVDTNGYLVARVVGLTMSLAVFVAGGSMLVGLVAVLFSHGRVVALHTVQASFAATVFGVAFALTFAPVALATLGARSRGRGYLALLAVLALPDLAHGWLSRWVSPDWLEVCSIPGALLSVRSALAPVGVDLGMLGRAVVALVVIVTVALLIVRGELFGAHASTDAGRGKVGHLP